MMLMALMLAYLHLHLSSLLQPSLHLLLKLGLAFEVLAGLLPLPLLCLDQLLLQFLQCSTAVRTYWRLPVLEEGQQLLNDFRIQLTEGDELLDHLLLEQLMFVDLRSW